MKQQHVKYTPQRSQYVSATRCSYFSVQETCYYNTWGVTILHNIHIRYEANFHLTESGPAISLQPVTLYISRNSIYKGGFTHSFLRKKAAGFLGYFPLHLFLRFFFSSTKTLWPSVCCRSMWSYEVNTNSLLIYIFNQDAACSRGGNFFCHFPAGFSTEQKKKNWKKTHVWIKKKATKNYVWRKPYRKLHWKLNEPVIYGWTSSGSILVMS